MLPSCPLPVLPDQSEFGYRKNSKGTSMSSQKLTCVKNILVRLKSLLNSSKNLFRRRSVPSSEASPNEYKILSGSPEIFEKVVIDSGTETLKDSSLSECRSDLNGGGGGGGGNKEATVGKSFGISSKVSPSREEKFPTLEVLGTRSGITEYMLPVPNYRMKYSKNTENEMRGVNYDLTELSMAQQNLSSTLVSQNLPEPRIVRIHSDAGSCSNSQQLPSTASNSIWPRSAKKMRRSSKALPDAVHKLKSGFLVATNHIAEKISTYKDGLKVNVDEPFTCKKTFRKCRSKESSKASKDSRSTAEREQKISFETDPNPMHLRRHGLVKDGVECHAENRSDEQSNLNPSNSTESKLPNPILDYTFLSMDYFYTVIEKLHDHMDLVRNGIQQLIDNFTQPSIMRLQDQETQMLQFKQSVEMLLHSIERTNYAMINLPDRISNMRYLLLPCKNTIREFNDHLQKMSIDLEHTQYFNNDSPMLTLLKMIVIIKILNAVMGRGRRAFIRSIDRQYGGSEENGMDFDVSCYHERFIRPTFDMLFRRTEAMVKLRNFSVVLSQRWVDSQDWNSFLPSLQEFMKLIKMVEPYLAVPQDWYAVRILPETRIMHVFDGFMSEFYRAIVTPGFANANPVAFGSIFTVIQFILDNIINQHVIILRDLNTGLKLQECESVDDGGAAESVNCLVNNSNGVCRRDSPLYENVHYPSNAVNDAPNALYQNI